MYINVHILHVSTKYISNPFLIERDCFLILSEAVLNISEEFEEKYKMFE